MIKLCNYRKLKEADWFVGDLSITYERNLVVDFSFLTLVDNEAFLTHAPGRLNEAFSLIRPFHWSVSYTPRSVINNYIMSIDELFSSIINYNICTYTMAMDSI